MRGLQLKYYYKKQNQQEPEKKSCKQRSKIMFSEISTIVLSLLLVKSYANESSSSEDINGYIVYCPCMGNL